MADRGRKRRPSSSPPSARPSTVAAVVASPWLPGKTDRVQRVLDSVLQLRRSGQISAAQYDAAERYRTAYEAVRAGMGGVMDPDRVGGGSSSGKIPQAAELAAADILSDASLALSRVGGTVIVEMVVGQGWTIADVTRSLFSEQPTEANRKHVGAFLRLSLTTLADRWFSMASRPSSTCAVERRDFPVGGRPTRQLSLRPVAIGAVVEVTKRLKPLV